MPAMSTVEQAFCRSHLWRWLTRRTIFPWALDGIDVSGDVLELGSGSGAMAGNSWPGTRRLPVDGIRVEPALGGLVARFAARRTDNSLDQSA